MDKILTIDGPSASGKGSLTRAIAIALNFNVLDSGLLYRAYAYFYEKGVTTNHIGKKIQNLSFRFNSGDVQVFDDMKEITSLLRSENTAKAASALSSKKETRKNLLDIQRSFYNGKGLVADGRDMGTVVFPEAKTKIFLYADLDARALRRFDELKKKGINTSCADVKSKIASRDKADIERDISPLVAAEDAIEIDSTSLSIEEVLSIALKVINS